MNKMILELHLTTEKSMSLKETYNSYVFRVDRDAGKIEIRGAVESAFGVKVDNVRTMVMPGKSKRLRYRVGRTPRWKKAIVTLEKGQVISDFENI